MTSESRQDRKRPTCPKCGNRLRVLPDQIGTSVRCPKCNATFVVGRSQDQAKTAASAPAAEDDAYEPIIPLPRPTMLPQEELADLNPAAARDTVYDTDWRTADDMQMEAPVERPPVGESELLEAARARGLIRDVRVVAPPRWTFASGVFTYPWKGANLTRWTAMSFGLGLAGMMAVTSLTWLGFLGGQANMLFGVMLSAFTIILSLAVLSFAAASCHAAIQDTADGHDAPLEDTLPDWDHWVFTFVSWLSLWAAAAAIGYPLSLAIGPVAFLITSTLVFPVFLLSAMECESYIVPYSPPVLRTLGYYFHGWLAFQLITVLLFAGWIVAFDFAFPQAPYLTAFLSGPALATIMLIYARLLGRLAWRASGAPMARLEQEDDERDESAHEAKPSKRPARKRRKNIRIEIPDEVEPGQVPETPRPRINFHLRP
jgi:predicted Zn finger-like uncharacterized protein